MLSTPGPVAVIPAVMMSPPLPPLLPPPPPQASRLSSSAQAMIFCPYCRLGMPSAVVLLTAGGVSSASSISRGAMFNRSKGR